MIPSLDNARKRLLFPSSADAFRADASDLLTLLQSDASTGALSLAADMALDLRSSLRDWVVNGMIDAAGLSSKEVEAAAEGFAGLVRARGDAEVVRTMEEEAAVLAVSETRKMCAKTAAGELATYWGHDYCTGMDFSLRRGARFVTSNPAKINLFRKENPECWAALLEEARRENPGASVTKIISAMFVKVTAINARALRPIFDATAGEWGFVCVQTNPKNINDSAAMVDEVLYWEKAYRTELANETINVVYKLPAVKAAVEAVKQLVAQGIRVCMTLNFTVSQHEIFADYIEAGPRNGFVVLMSGFLDDNVALELGQLGVEDPKRYAKWAGVAVMRKSYANLCARGVAKAAIMAAAIRGPYTIASCLTDRASAPVCFTTMPEKIREFDAADNRLVSEMDDAVPDDVMAVLSRSAIFNQAYNRDQLDMDSVADFAPLRAVLDVFTKAYIEIEESI